MSSVFWRRAVASGLLTIVLVGVRVFDPMVSAITIGGLSAKQLLKTLHKRELNREDADEQTAGYYEGLLSESTRVSSMNHLITGRARPARRHAEIHALRQPDKYHIRGDFLYYEAKPNLDVPDYEDQRLRLVTNSFGMADREYSTEKPQGTRRIAILGDSVTRGMGAPFGASYEALLENRLNERHVGGKVRRFEVLNFAVGGYRLTQLLDVAATKAPVFQPDTYLVALSELSISRKWGDHIEQLVSSGVDLKYDFLKQVAREAQLRPGEPAARVDAKLARFRLPTLKWAVSEIRARARQQGADLVVLLIPTVREPDSLEAAFKGVREALAQLEVPVIDLLDAFAGVVDLDPFRVSSDNVHPSDQGHRMIFENLYRKLLEQPSVLAQLIGSSERRPVAEVAR